MRQRHPDGSQSISRGELAQFELSAARQGLPWLAVFVSLALVTLACAVIGPSSVDRVVSRTRLPTLTPTRLPTLTPTPVSTPVAVAQALEPESAAAVVEPVGSNPIPAGPLAPADVSGPGAAPGLAEPAAATLLQAPADAPNPEPALPSPPASEISANLPTPTVAELLPSATPTEALPTSTATAIPTEAPTPTPAPTETPTATPLPEGWVFSGVRGYPDQEEGGLLLHGQVINNTGVAQELLSITGTFYDGPGQVIAGHDDTYAFWPPYVVPAGGSMPFELIVDSLDNAANFDLSVEAEPSSEAVQHDFEFSDLNQWTEDDLYCLAGRMRNLGGEVQDYLIIAAVLYDAQDNVINFGDYQEFGRIGLAGDASSDFEICVDPPNQDVARYELQAWGQ